MDLLIFVFVIAIVGCIVYLLTTYVPMPAPFKIAIQVIAVIALILYSLRALGIVIPNLLR